MLIRIDDIEIGERFRKDLGDIGDLARSIADIGLLHPIVVTPDMRLIAGQRRIAACQSLGLTEIEATVININSIVKGEFAENECRKDFTWSERVEIAAAIEPVEREAAKERMQSHTETGYVKFTDPAPALDKVAAAVGVSRPTLVKAREIYNSGDEDLIQEMDRTGKVTGAYRELKRRQDAEKLATVSTPEGKYRTIVIDPPWDWGDEGDVSQMGRSVPTYSTIPYNDLLKLPVSDLAMDDCHLYLWITNRSLYKGFSLIESWGFRYITTLTWCKPSIGIGNYYRNNTEHILFAVKGALRLLRFDKGTWFLAERGKEHSQKPDEAYQLIAECSPEPRLDMFARSTHSGFVSWGNVNEPS